MGRDLTDWVIVITGASSGIGKATAVACAKAGMHVVINARRADRLKEVSDLVRQCGRSAEAVVGDVTDAGMSSRLLDAAQARFGRCDVVFANAGYGLERSVVELSDDELRQIFEVNFFAAHDLLQQAARRMVADRRGGHLLMCSSCVGKFTLPYHAAYSATKAAQSHFCRAMRLEMASHGIEVSCVHPITTSTEFWGAMADQSGQAGRSPALLRSTPRPFVQSPSKVARAIVKCLRRPRAEVWTSRSIRMAAGLFTMFPSFMDFALRGRARRHAKR